jgi:hypothetical protein
MPDEERIVPLAFNKIRDKKEGGTWEPILP